MKYLLAELFDKPISGEWGKEVEEGELGVKVIRTTNFTNLGILNLKDVVNRNIDLEKNIKKQLKFGDIIIEKSGGSPAQPVGRTVIFEEKDNQIYFCNNFTSVLRPGKNIYPKYALYLLKDLYNKRKVLKYQNKTTGIINLKLNDYLENTEVEIPNLNIQQKVSNILDKAQELINKRKEQIEALDDLVKSQFIEMFGDPILNPKGWEKLMLQECCSKVTDGTHDTPQRFTEGKLLITGKNIRKDKIDLTDIEYVSEEDHEIIYKRCNPEYGDVLYTNIGVNYGTAVINSLDYEFSMKNVALLKPNRSKINGIYLWHYLNLCRPYILEQNKAGGAQTFMSLATIKKLNVVIPQIEFQNKFADFVKQVDKLKFELENSLKESEDNFNSLMQKAFKGQLFN